MGIYTGDGLAAHAEKALALNTKYMWGGILRPITPNYIAQLKSIYGTKSGTGYTTARWEQLQQLANKGYYGCDCIGLIKSYYWSGSPTGGTGSPKYGVAGFPDVNANYMYSQARIKGEISTLPERAGIVVYCKTHPHVGVYVGGGYVIESTLGSRGDGVVKTRLSDFGWEYWFECPYIEYPKQTASQSPKFAIGDKVYIKQSAKCYSGTNIAIPSYCKGKSGTYTVAKVLSGRLLLKELFSWVDSSDCAHRA